MSASIAEAMYKAGRKAGKHLMRATITDKDYKHVVVYDINNPTERSAVGARISECLSQGLNVSTQEFRK